jgi:isoleucyl-tRNA synthetase
MSFILQQYNLPKDGIVDSRGLITDDAGLIYQGLDVRKEETN